MDLPGRETGTNDCSVTSLTDSGLYNHITLGTCKRHRDISETISWFNKSSLMVLPIIFDDTTADDMDL